MLLLTLSRHPAASTVSGVLQLCFLQEEQSVRKNLGTFLCYLHVLIYIDLGIRWPEGKQESPFLDSTCQAEGS